jgi:isocitrate lyase
MTAYSALQEKEFGLEKDGYEAVKHQRFVGTGYFDQIQNVVTSGKASTKALDHSTEAEQFQVAESLNGHGSAIVTSFAGN